MKYEIHKYNIFNGKTSVACDNRLISVTDIIHLLNNNISYCYYWPVGIYE